MPIFFDTNFRRAITDMSSPKKAEVRRGAVLVGGVTVRPASDREEEFIRACRDDRIKLSTPIPRPASGTPHKFWIGRGPPIPAPPQRRPINPIALDIPDDARRIQAAAISARARDANKRYLRPLLEEAASAAAAPREQSPPRADDDHYDLARWSRRYSRWN